MEWKKLENDDGNQAKISLKNFNQLMVSWLFWVITSLEDLVEFPVKRTRIIKGVNLTFRRSHKLLIISAVFWNTSIKNDLGIRLNLGVVGPKRKERFRTPHQFRFISPVSMYPSNTSWWFQALSKIWVKMGSSSPNFQGEHSKNIWVATT